MKKLLLLLILCWFLRLPCAATAMVEQGLASFGADKLAEMIPPQATEIAQEAGFDSLSVQDMLRLNPGQLLNALKASLKNALQSAGKTLFAIIGTVLLCALLKAIAQEGDISKLFEGVAVLAVTAALGAPVVACVEQTAQVVLDVSRFLISYVPVYTTVITAGGQPATATAYGLTVMAAAQIASQIATNLLIPLCGVYLALCIAGGIGQNAGVSAFSFALKRFIVWCLTLTMTVFTGVLTLQSFMSSAADGAAVKTTKFLVGSFVPVVGGAISDAIASAQGCIQLIKATVGSFGIAIAVLTFLPVLTRLMVLRIVLALSTAAGETLGTTQIKGILGGFSNALTVLTALLLSMGLFIIISTAVMMAAGGAGG